jgi:DNA-binding transcriptional LysR family regulator
MLDWNDLRYFLAIHRSATLSGAGRTLKVDQTTVGRRLAAMEAALGARLFVRHLRGFTLTPAGDAILPTAERVEEALLSLERKVAGDDARLEGAVRVATTEALADRLLVPSLPALRAAHPGIRVELVCETQLLDLGRGDADIAVRIVRAEQDNLLSRRVGEAAFALYAAHTYIERRGAPRHLDDLEGHDVLGYDDSLGHLPAARWLDDVASKVNCPFKGSTMLALTAAAAEGLGLAVLPCFLGETDPRLCRVAAPETVAAQSIWLVLHPDVQRIARIRVTMQHLGEVFRANAHLLRGDAAPPIRTR